MYRYIKSTTDPKILSLDMFKVRNYLYPNYRGEKFPFTDYLLNIDGYRISIYQVFGLRPYSINFTYPSGYSGEVGGFKTAQDAVNYLNENKWWTFKEPSQDQVEKAIDDDYLN